MLREIERLKSETWPMQKAISWLVVAILSWSATNSWGQPTAGPGVNGTTAAPLPPPRGQTGGVEAVAPAMRWEPRRPLSPPVLGPNGISEPLPGSVLANAGADAEPIPPCADGVHRKSFWEAFKAQMQWSHWGYPEEFVKVPIGTSFRAHRQVQICNGQAAGLVLYRYDFCNEGGQESIGLNTHGQKRLYLMLVQRRLGGGQPLVIERTPDNPQLDITRREHVLRLLANARVPAAVVIGEPLTPSMSGVEAQLLDANLRPRAAGAGEGPKTEWPRDESTSGSGSSSGS